MCGIFGSVGNSINDLILQKIAGEALKRGPQAYGIAWIENVNICKQMYANAINSQKAFKNIIGNCRAILGHCRLASNGTFKELSNNQPIMLVQTAISHKGNVGSYLQIVDETSAELESDCDSEIICHMVNRFDVEESIKRLSAEVPMALLILLNNKITAFWKGQPLYVRCVDGCHYLCSREFTGSIKVEEGKIIEFGG